MAPPELVFAADQLVRAAIDGHLGQVVAEPLSQLVQQADGGIGDHRAGREDRGRARGIQLVEIAGRDDTADNDHDVGPADRGQRVAQRRHQRQMPGGQRGHPHHVHVVVGGLPRHLVGRGEQ